MSDRDSTPTPVLARWAGPAALGLLFVGLTAWSFRKWSDVHIDFGNELYIAWRLAEGDVLYRDIAHRNGPFSHYVNALWFRAFGASLATLVAANLAVLAAIAAMLWRLFARGCDRLTATLCVAVLLTVFAFGQYAVIGNFNYVTPYMHAQTHALALSLLLLIALDAGLAAASAAPCRAWTVLAGVCLGAVFLTKAELFVPAAAMTAAAWGVGRWASGDGTPGGLPRAAWLALGIAVPLGVFGLLLGTRMPLSQAARGMLGNWAFLGGVAGDAFYVRGAGLDDPLGHGMRILATSAALALGVAAVAGLDRLLERWLSGREGRDRLRVAGAWSVGALAGIAAVAASPPWWRAAFALPVFAVLAVVVLTRRLRAARSERERRRLLPLQLLSVLALFLLAKTGLTPGFDHYGFVLAMPATLLGVAGLAGALPRRLQAGYGGGALARALAVAACVSFMLALLSVSQRHYAGKTFEIGPGADAILARGPEKSRRASVLAQTLALLEGRRQPGDTLLVLPDGMQLNYWLRMRNPSRFLIFLPTEIQAFGEAAMRADLEAHPPDFVVLVHRLWHEFGVGPFGSDARNGRALRAWVDANYRRVQRFGAEPFGEDGFGVVVLERSAAAR